MRYCDERCAMADLQFGDHSEVCLPASIQIKIEECLRLETIERLGDWVKICTSIPYRVRIYTSYCLPNQSVLSILHIDFGLAVLFCGHHRFSHAQFWTRNGVFIVTHFSRDFVLANVRAIYSPLFESNTTSCLRCRQR